MLKLDDKWLWDFWTAHDGHKHHLFYLSAPKSLGDEALRHWHADIGHATTEDFHSFDILPDIQIDAPKQSNGLEPFDSGTRWTGSIIQHNDLWYLFYTGTRSSENGKYQRIGAATSRDLHSWQKIANHALVQPDGHYYETYQPDLWFDQACRDPHVWRDNDGLFHMAFTARSNQGPTDQRGCIGHAVSANLLQWRLRPPLAFPRRYGQMEVPQLIDAQEHRYLMFCNVAETVSSQERQRLLANGRRAETFNHYLVAEQNSHDFHEPLDGYLTGDDDMLYAGKLIKRAQDDWVLLGFRNRDKSGHFYGELAAPIPVHLNQGRIQLQRSATTT